MYFKDNTNTNLKETKSGISKIVEVQYTIGKFSGDLPSLSAHLLTIIWFVCVATKFENLFEIVIFQKTLFRLHINKKQLT